MYLLMSDTIALRKWHSVFLCEENNSDKSHNSYTLNIAFTGLMVRK